jgi:hypothetical protein
MVRINLFTLQENFFYGQALNGSYMFKESNSV